VVIAAEKDDCLVFCDRHDRDPRPREATDPAKHHCRHQQPDAAGSRFTGSPAGASSSRPSCYYLLRTSSNNVSYTWYEIFREAADRARWSNIHSIKTWEHDHHHHHPQQQHQNDIISYYTPVAAPQQVMSMLVVMNSCCEVADSHSCFGRDLKCRYTYI